jgi:hypothetical protein
VTDDTTRWLQILGLEKGAAPEEIRRVYLDLVQVWHPDRFVNNARLRLKAQEKLKEINAAYHRLTHRPQSAEQPDTKVSSHPTSDDSQHEARTRAGGRAYTSRQSDHAAAATKVPTSQRQSRFTAAFIFSVLAIILALALTIKIRTMYVANTRPMAPVIIGTTPARVTVNYWFCFEANDLVRIETATPTSFIERILRPKRSDVVTYYTADAHSTQYSGYGTRGYSNNAALFLGQQITVTAANSDRKVDFRIWEQPRDERRMYFACGGR